MTWDSPEPEPYAKQPALQALAVSLKGATILDAELLEAHGKVVVRVWLDHSRRVDIGAAGNLYDEAFFVFEQTVPGGDPRARSR